MKKIIYFAMLLGLLFSVDAAAQSGKKIYINPGHGQYTGNDRNIATINHNLGDTNGFYESSSNCRKGNYLYDFLVGNGCGAQRSRTTTGPGLDHALSSIASWANNYGATVFIAIHSNAANASANYLQVLFNGTTSSPTYPASKTVGNALWDKMFPNVLTSWTAYSATNKCVIGDQTFLGYNLGVLRPLTRPGVLTEGSFHDYMPEAHRLLSKAYCRLEAWNMFRGFNQYFGTSIGAGSGNGKGGAVVGWVKDNTKQMNNARYKFRSGTEDQWTPINGCKVELLNSAGTSVVDTYTCDNEYNGVFGFFGIAAGSYKLRFSASGYNCKIVDVSVTTGGTTYSKQYLAKGSTPCAGVTPPPTPTASLAVNLSSVSSGNTPVGNSQAAGNTVYLYIKDNNGNVISRQDCDLTSSDASVATISVYGTISTLKAGTTVIKAVRKTDKAAGQLTLTVTGSVVTPTSITLGFSTIPNNDPYIVTTGAVQVGKKIYLTIKDNTGAYITRASCTLTSSNPAIATIDAAGEITGVANGNVTITAVRKTGGTGTATATVTVSGGVTPPANALKLSLSKETGNNVPTTPANTADKGTTVYLWITDNAGAVVSRQHCTLTSNNPAVATISAYGTITPVGVGTVTITAVRDLPGSDNKGVKDGAKGTLTFVVNGTPDEKPPVGPEVDPDKPVESVMEPLTLSLDKPSIDLGKNETASLTIRKKDGTSISRLDCELMSENLDIATISVWGTVTGISAGTAVLRAYYTDAKGVEYEGQISIVVTGTAAPPAPTPFTLRIVPDAAQDVPELDEILVGGAADLIIIKDDGSGRLSRLDFNLTSSDVTVATISTTGRITGIGEGTVIFRAVHKTTSQQAQIPLVVHATEQEGVKLITPEGAKIFVRSTPTGIVVEFEAEALIELFTVNGLLIDKTKAYKTYSRDLAKGAYIVRVNSNAIKFIKSK